MVQKYPLTKELIQNFPIKNVRETFPQNLISADDAVLYIEDLIQCMLAAINSCDPGKMKECWQVAEQLFLLNEERVISILSMHFMITVFPILEKKIPSHKEIKHMLPKELLFHFNYYLTLENNWLH